jgi:hypothetical protein
MQKKADMQPLPVVCSNPQEKADRAAKVAPKTDILAKMSFPGNEWDGDEGTWSTREPLRRAW